MEADRSRCGARASSFGVLQAAMLSVALAACTTSKPPSPVDSRSAAIAFRAVATEATGMVAPVVRLMPPGLEEPAGEWPIRARGPWRLFFAGSSLHIGSAPSRLPLFAYYNPFSDVVVLGLWELPEAEGDSPRVQRICALPAEFLRGAQRMEAIEPPWLGSADPIASLHALATETARALEGRFPGQNAKSAELSEDFCSDSYQKAAELRLYELAGGVSMVARTGALEAVTKLLAVAPRGTESVAAAFPRLPEKDRQTAGMVGRGFEHLVPAAVLGYSGESGLLLILAHAPSGSQFVSLGLTRRAKGWTVERVQQWRLDRQRVPL